MSRANTTLRSSLTSSRSGCGETTIVMVHSSLGRVGWTQGGPLTVIAALLEVLGPRGTLVMPAESPQLADPTNAAVFDPLTTPTTMGAIPEAFRSYPGTLRSNHPLGSVCANGQSCTGDHCAARARTL